MIKFNENKKTIVVTLVLLGISLGFYLIGRASNNDEIRSYKQEIQLQKSVVKQQQVKIDSLDEKASACITSHGYAWTHLLNLSGSLSFINSNPQAIVDELNNIQPDLEYQLGQAEICDKDLAKKLGY